MWSDHLAFSKGKQGVTFVAVTKARSIKYRKLKKYLILGFCSEVLYAISEIEEITKT